mmetsp:Transcript_15193/g.23846  ORF Transcript_15193/g.23846 Transcript_15193/m.23846 type:complete len:210 (+) Transcript_15193:745-1374(+)
MSTLALLFFMLSRICFISVLYCAISSFLRKSASWISWRSSSPSLSFCRINSLSLSICCLLFSMAPSRSSYLALCDLNAFANSLNRTLMSFTLLLMMSLSIFLYFAAYFSCTRLRKIDVLSLTFTLNFIWFCRSMLSSACLCLSSFSSFLAFFRTSSNCNSNSRFIFLSSRLSSQIHSYSFSKLRFSCSKRVVSSFFALYCDNSCVYLFC